MSEYNLYGKFDVNNHITHFPHYLEGVIDTQGEFHYAVPSHQEKLISMACNMHNCTRDQLDDMCPAEYYFDFLTWLLIQTNCVAVWTGFIQYVTLSEPQLSTLKLLKSKGAYEGDLPDMPN